MSLWTSLWSRVAGSQTLTARVSGAPTSSNGASSFHLDWVLPGRFTSASVDLEILDAPVVPRLYFWAMQVDLGDDTSRPVGGAHLGLQWHPGHPGSRAVNWGGYRSNGTELAGSRSPLRSATGNPNTRDLYWTERHRYRLAVARVTAAGSTAPGGATAWRGTVSDLDTGDQVVVRDLWSTGQWITRVTMWSEVFARCDDPQVLVRWSSPRAVTADGVEERPASVRVNYQTHEAGGCANTDSSRDPAGGILQRTAVPRVTAQGSSLPVGHSED